MLDDYDKNLITDVHAEAKHCYHYFAEIGRDEVGQPRTEVSGLICTTRTITTFVNAEEDESDYTAISNYIRNALPESNKRLYKSNKIMIKSLTLLTTV